MTEQVSWVTYTVPAREKRATELKGQLGGGLIVDHVGGKANRILNELAAWELSLGAGLPWAGVTQDDLILCNNFPFHADLRLKEARRMGFPVVCFYSGRKQNQDAKAKGKRWERVRGKDFLAPLAICMQAPIAEAYVKYARAHFDPEEPWIDVMNARFFSVCKFDVQISVPSMVDHDVEVPSTLGHAPNAGKVKRTSRTFHFRAR